MHPAGAAEQADSDSTEEEALEAEEARLVCKLAKANRRERIGVLRRQIDKTQAEQPVASEGMEGSQASSSILG